jgi:hypothetical protein
VYGTSKTDKDLIFSAATLEALERSLTAEQQQQYPLVMRPGMRLPRTCQCSSSPAAQQVLTWRRFFHTQMAAVYSGLFRSKVPQVAVAPQQGAAPVEHDFVFVR